MTHQVRAGTHATGDSPATPFRINIIGKSNGVGLTRDLKLLAHCLGSAGHDVSLHAVDAEQAKNRRSLLAQSAVRLQHAWGLVNPTSPRRDVDVNLMLEHVWPQFFSQAARNVVVPNPEWFDRNDLRFLSRTDRVWAKTQHAVKIFQGLGRSTCLIGFDSEDRHEPSVRRERRFLHLAGKSTMKGTDRLLRVWAQRPDWPTLTVIQHSADMHAPEISADNIDRRIGYLDDAQVRQEQNANMFHVCLSITEGWGHYLAEALSVGAVPLTLDAPPMNELVTAERGLLVPYDRTGMQRLAQTYFFSEAGLHAAVERAIAMSEEEWAALSAAGRRWFETNRSDFPRRVQAAMEQLAGQ